MRSKSEKRLLVFFTVLLVAFVSVAPVTAAAAGKGGVTELIPGGMPFGVKLFTAGAVVIGTAGVETASGVEFPAKDADIRAGDVIIRAGGREFSTASELIDCISGSGGNGIDIALLRGGEELTVSVSPARDIESGEWRIGVLIRDSTAGIGTVTFIDPETDDFGGLGHGIYESTTGILMPMASGTVVDVKVTSVVKSERNSPGELRGDFGTVRRGTLWSNTEEGVFGRFDRLPAAAREPIPVAKNGELTTGAATILTTVSGETPAEYDIEIEQIYGSSGSTKNFLLRVTDERLIETTGGIVQGMSGSPIIQNGKLVGAVTHVLVNDPTRGYGILIGNMLSEAYGVLSQQNAA